MTTYRFDTIEKASTFAKYITNHDTRHVFDVHVDANDVELTVTDDRMYDYARRHIWDAELDTGIPIKATF